MEMNLERAIDNRIIKLPFIMTAQELIDNDITEIPWLWEKFIPLRGLTIISGSSDTGKSTFLRQWSLALVSGEADYLGHRLMPRFKSVIYVSTEDDILSLSPRLKEERNYFSTTGDFSNLRFIFDYEDILSKIREAYDLQPADCLILDAFGDIFDGDPNSASATRSFMNYYKALADEYGCAVVFLHHLRKAASSGTPDKNDLLGSMAIEAKARSVLMLSQGDSRRDRRILKVVKGNYITPEEKRITYNLSFEDGFFELLDSTGLVNTSTTDETITKAVYDFSAKGLSLREIAEALKSLGYGISKSSVYRILKK
jgi:RecA-family ATPase